MGIVNVTPDSFSDGGLFADPDAAIAHGRRLVAEGADVIDVGGESTRPGAHAVDEATELHRVLPVIEALSADIRVSVDTSKPAVARAAVAAGASIINDVTASLHEVAADTGAGWVAMHMQGDPRTMQVAPRYGDVVAEVYRYLAERAEAAQQAGVDEVWVDPGIGFGKTHEHNLALLRHLPELVALGWPVAIGVSRKGFLGRVLADSDGAAEPVDVADRLEGSLAAATWAMACGAALVRVHDVAPTVQAAKVVAALPAGSPA
jgi:dihydropteroate synthase